MNESSSSIDACDNSNPERMSWWRANGKKLVAAQNDPSKEEEKKILTESLLSHNQTVALAAPDSSFTSPEKENGPRSPARDSLSEKRRKAAEARQKALALRSKGNPLPQDTEPQPKEDHEKPPNESSFAQARQFLQNRVMPTAGERLVWGMGDGSDR